MWHFTKTTRVNTCKNDACKKKGACFFSMFNYIQLAISFKYHLSTIKTQDKKYLKYHVLCNRTKNIE